MAGLNSALTESADHTDAISPEDPAIVEVVNKLVRLWTVDARVVEHMEGAHRTLSLALIRIREGEFRSAPGSLIEGWLDEALESVSEAYCVQADVLSGDDGLQRAQGADVARQLIRARVAVRFDCHGRGCARPPRPRCRGLARWQKDQVRREVDDWYNRQRW